MMFHGCPDVEAGFQMGVPHLLCVRFYMDLDCATQWCKELPHVVMLAMDVGMGRDLWGYVGLVSRLTVSSSGLRR
jgi:hypothetical protein